MSDADKYGIVQNDIISALQPMLSLSQPLTIAAIVPGRSVYVMTSSNPIHDPAIGVIGTGMMGVKEKGRIGNPTFQADTQWQICIVTNATQGPELKVSILYQWLGIVGDYLHYRTSPLSIQRRYRLISERIIDQPLGASNLLLVGIATYELDMIRGGN